MRTVPQHARLALLLEVSSTPKPGNVDREREYEDLRFEHFVAGAVGTEDGFERAAGGGAVGDSFERAVAGMSEQTGGNTQFGAVLLLVPLVRAAANAPRRGEFDGEDAAAVVRATTVADAVDFYRAFEHVDVAVDEPPEGMEDLDVRQGGDAEPALRDRGLTLADVMERSASVDGLAAEYVNGFERTFAAASAIADGDGPVTERTAAVFLDLLAAEPDTFIATQHDRETAQEVTRRAAAARAGEESVTELAAEFVERGINPGTTADIVAGGLFVALERGVEV
ncbi:MAG: triphosphoribosyl-dephospho-CoA synthase [Halovenus sp.]